MRIANNIMAMNTHRQYTINNNAVSKSAEKLSSGYRINRAGDDAAGLAISEKMRSQIRGLNMASKNSQDGNSLIQTAEGALQEVHSMLQRMNELAVQSASGTNQEIDREALELEYQQLVGEINDISEQTTFNNMNLLDGSLGGGNVAVNLTGVVGAAFGGAVAGSGIGGAGTALKNSVVTSWGGFSQGVGKGTIAVGYYNAAGAWTAGADTIGATDKEKAQNTIVRMTFVGDDGRTSTVESTLSAVYDFGFDAAGAATNDSIAKGGQGKLNLSGIGLGKVEFVAGTGGAVATDLADIAGALQGMTVTSTAGAGGGGESLAIQVGAKQGETMEIDISAMNATSLGVAGQSIATQTMAGAAITATRDAINLVSTQRATLGAAQNRLEHKIANLDTSAENLSAAESRIRDVDLASEMTSFTKNNILSQAATAMLAQANTIPQNVLQLLR